MSEKKRMRTLAPKSSVPVTVGSDRIAEKLLAPENGLLALFADKFNGITIQPEKQRFHQPTRTVNIFTLTGSNAEKRIGAKTAMMRIIETIQTQEKTALENILRDPKKYAKKNDLQLAEDESHEVTGVFTTANNLLKSVLTEDKKQKNVKRTEIGQEAESAIHKISQQIFRAKNSAVGQKNTAVIKVILESISFDVDASEFPEGYAGRIASAKNYIDTYLIALDDRITAHNEEQAQLTTAAKYQFADDERASLRTAVQNSLGKKASEFDEQEKELILNNAFRAISAVAVTKSSLEQTVKSTIKPTPAELVQQQKDAEDLKKLQGFKQYSLGSYTPQTDSQVAQVKSMQKNGLTIVVGDAGTGKSLAAIAYALHRLKTEKKKILILRPMTELGNQETIGYLPGGELEKIGPGFRPILKNLLKLEPNKSKLKQYLGLDNQAGGKDDDKKAAPSVLDFLIPDQDILIMPMAYIRGDTFDDYTIIVEEAQNLTLMEAEAIATRAGKNTQVILAGDKIQTDLPTKDRQGRWLDEKKMPALPLLLDQAENNAAWMGVVIHPEENIVRSELAKKTVGLFRDIRENKEDVYNRAFSGYGANVLFSGHANGNGHKQTFQASSVSPS